MIELYDQANQSENLKVEPEGKLMQMRKDIIFAW